MSTSSSEEGPGMAGHPVTLSGSELTSTAPLLFSVPSDASGGILTEITSPVSPAPIGGKNRTPRNILDASHRLGQIFAEDMVPARPPKRLCHRALAQCINDEAGYDADGNVDEDGDTYGHGRGHGHPGMRVGITTSTTARPVRRSRFLRIDTRQHRRVASMPAGPGISHPRPPRARLAPSSPTRPKSTVVIITTNTRSTSTSTGTTSAAAAAGRSAINTESYEFRTLRRHGPRVGAKWQPPVGPIGLGIGFPENHPLRSRAFTMPVSSPRMSTSLAGPDDDGYMLELPPMIAGTITTGQDAVYAPRPVWRQVLRPTFMEVSPSPIEYLPAARAGSEATANVVAVQCAVDVYDPSESAVCVAGTTQTSLGRAGVCAGDAVTRRGMFAIA